jgi:TonB family protein
MIFAALCFFITVLCAPPVQAASCSVTLAEYFLIGSGQQVLQYQVTLRSHATGMMSAHLMVQAGGTTRSATFNADFEPNPLNKFPSNPPEYDVVVLFPWERGPSPSVALEVNGAPCSSSVALQSNEIDPVLVPFDDAGIKLSRDLQISTVSQNAFVQRVTPIYPDMAKDRGISGSVQVAVVVGKGGRVISSWILQTSHSDLLDNAALDAARASTFQEPQSGGQPVIAAYRIEYTFAL